MSTNNKSKSTESVAQEWEEIQAAKSSPNLFKPLYNRYYEAIFRFIYNRCGDQIVSKDICSQVFLKAMQNLNNYHYRGLPFSAWLYKIAQNEIAQYYRNSKKVRTVNIESIHLVEISEDLQLDNFIYYREKMLVVLEGLNPLEMQLIELRFFEKRPFKEIAFILEMTEINAKMKTYRTLEKMKKIIINKK